MDFHDLVGGSKMETNKKNENAARTCLDFGLRSSRPSQNDLLKFPTQSGVFNSKNQSLTELSKKFEAPGGADFQSIAETE